MKKFLVSFSALVLVVVLMTGCKKSAKDVAQTWLNGFYHMDYEAAKKVSTPETDSFVSQIQQLAGIMQSDSAKTQMKKIVVTIKDVKEEGDKAVVSYSISDIPGKDQMLHLVKKDGNWKVQFTKNDQMYGGADPGPDQPAGVDTTTSAAVDTAMSDTMKH